MVSQSLRYQVTPSDKDGDVYYHAEMKLCRNPFVIRSLLRIRTLEREGDQLAEGRNPFVIRSLLRMESEIFKRKEVRVAIPSLSGHSFGCTE